MRIFNFLASRFSLGDWFESRFVRNSKDRVSPVEANITDKLHNIYLNKNGQVHKIAVLACIAMADSEDSGECA